MNICKAELLVPEPSIVEVEIAIEKLNRYKSLGTDHILSEMIKARGETLCSEINLFVLYGILCTCATTVEGIYHCTNL
jgi:hypothetical protein